MTFSIKQNDSSPAIVYILSDDSGPVNLTGATVWFHMGTGLSALAVVVDALAGKVSYSWAAEDTARAGFFRAEFEAIYADGSKETYPNEGYIGVNISPDIGNPPP